MMVGLMALAFFGGVLFTTIANLGFWETEEKYRIDHIDKPTSVGFSKKGEPIFAYLVSEKRYQESDLNNGKEEK